MFSAVNLKGSVLRFFPCFSGKFWTLCALRTASVFSVVYFLSRYLLLYVISMINKDRLIKITRDLIRINSENPPGDESAIAGYVADFFAIPGVKVRVVELKPKRPNVLVYMKGAVRHTLLLGPHMDTVPAGTGWKYGPFSGTVKSGRIYGRGASDCKGNLAAAMEAMRSLIEDKITPASNVLLAACADEETGSRYGIKGLLERDMIRADSALILDSDDFSIIVAQKGLIHFRIKVYGKKAHGAYPDKGINAIELGAGIIMDLKRYRFKFRKHALLKAPTVNIGTIKGGDKVNIVSDWCEFSVDIRFLPGMSDSLIMDDVKKIIRRYTGKFKVEIDDIQKPYEIDTRHSSVKCLAEAAKNTRVKSCISGSEGATVITFFHKKKIPAVSIGFGAPGCAHISDEYAKINDLYNGARLLDNFLRIYKGANALSLLA